MILEAVLAGPWVSYGMMREVTHRKPCAANIMRSHRAPGRVFVLQVSVVTLGQQCRCPSKDGVSSPDSLTLGPQRTSIKWGSWQQ